MKTKGIIVFFLICFFGIINFPLQANHSLLNHTTNFINYRLITATEKPPGRKAKDGRFRRKKGFMWGLFKGKSACDCPKH